MNNGGKFNTLVEEVIELSKNYGQVSLEKEDVDKIQVIYDYGKAEYLAYEEVYGEEEYSWKDIRELEMSDVWERYYDLTDAEKTRELEEIVEVIAENLRQSLEGYDAFFEDIVADLNNCAISRAVNGTENNFFESIFKLHRSEYLPCGWSGDYPDGGIIAYRG
ncbi:hypothetical protein M3592_11360 [Priestia aryabhattai]|uniref:Cytoplasmic protein n=2 Tax=Priestia TaxID=2800373 RepID=A0A806THY6_PRIMG|nr:MULTISPECIES: hypothetical protein [Priestia]MCL9635014.1 hypothetical protein [Bacillus zanthoxyli]AKP77762.1 hypothetical protein AS52_02801 [Priestia megaterium Q3]MCM2976033.1 hypothetical protein [Priestia aryabhattai]MED4013026.1 hypothetical protein [Priestia aryabhattai]PGA13453.1 hypothetical protein COL65_23385 [Priestia aryabhattai]